MIKFVSLASVAAVSSLFFIGTTTAAEAASNCPSSGALACYYNGANYSSTRGTIPDGGVPGGCGIGDIYNYWASSLYNNSVNDQTWYTGRNYGGSKISVGRQSGRTTLSSTFNNNVRSWGGTCYGGARKTSVAVDSGPAPTPR